MTTEEDPGHGHEHNDAEQAEFLKRLRAMHDESMDKDLSCEFVNALTHHVSETLAGLEPEGQLTMLRIISESADGARKMVQTKILAEVLAHLQPTGEGH